MGNRKAEKKIIGICEKRIDYDKRYNVITYEEGQLEKLVLILQCIWRQKIEFILLLKRDTYSISFNNKSYNQALEKCNLFLIYFSRNLHQSNQI